MGHILAETDASNNILFYYIHGLGLECRIRASDMTVSFYHGDFRGSTIAMTDETAQITHSYSYLPFGELIGSTEADPNTFKYVGRYGVMDEGDNIYYMRARYMDANTGRFLSEDPVWGENLYSYAGSNPIMAIDPNGRVVGFAGAVFGGVAEIPGAVIDAGISVKYATKGFRSGFVDHNYVEAEEYFDKANSLIWGANADIVKGMYEGWAGFGQTTQILFEVNYEAGKQILQNGEIDLGDLAIDLVSNQLGGFVTQASGQDALSILLSNLSVEGIDMGVRQVLPWMIEIPKTKFTP